MQLDKHTTLCLVTDQFFTEKKTNKHTGTNLLNQASWIGCSEEEQTVRLPPVPIKHFSEKFQSVASKMFLVCPTLKEMNQTCAFPILHRCLTLLWHRVSLEVALCSVPCGGHPGFGPTVSRRRCWGHSGIAGRFAEPKDPGKWRVTVNGWGKRPRGI